ncbi:hypothetical protein BJY01DRAFT_207466 [Aspergillus pseudoustus]|uniref:Uncharacterized protein n=1 Tax=Aspergillus pseudoustus TaxID=1810923 RepID=A0ABR4KKW4_9EURO
MFRTPLTVIYSVPNSPKSLARSSYCTWLMEPRGMICSSAVRAAKFLDAVSGLSSSDAVTTSVLVVLVVGVCKRYAASWTIYVKSVSRSGVRASIGPCSMVESRSST